MTELLELFQYNFFINALIASLLASISCGIIGTYIVSKRMVFIAGGITHASFGGIGLGYFLGISPILGATGFSILAAFAIEYFSKKIKIRQDSAIGIFWSFGMAIGIIFIYITPGYAPNLMSYLFGSILSVTVTELVFMGGVSVVIAFFFLIYFRLILFIAYDEEYAKTQNAPVSFINYFLIAFIALTIVINIRIVGIILVISLLTIPQTIANMLTKDFKKIIFIAIAIGFIGTLSGLVAAYFLDIPSGASIIFTLVLIFLCIKGIQLVKKSSAKI